MAERGGGRGAGSLPGRVGKTREGRPRRGGREGGEGRWEGGRERLGTGDRQARMLARAGVGQSRTRRIGRG